MEQVGTYVALLRGINVGGKHIVPMKQLAEIFTDAKCGNVRTYIQSGNVVFTASPKVAKALAARVAKNIEERFGFSVPVVMRNREELAQVARNNPFLKAGLPQQTLHVYFLADLPTADAVRSLDPNRSTPDRFHVSDSEIYLHMPNGMGRTKLTCAYFDSKLSTIATARNWNAVLKLLEMMG
jgi:uncharacterized protein (DUF1697 family)